MNEALNRVDLAFIVDTTGSMGPFIGTAQAQMTAMLRVLTAESPVPLDLQVGVVEYRDHPPQDSSFVARVHPFATRLDTVQKTIESLKPDGGGDAPEAVYDGLCAAWTELTWRAHSHRLAFLVGDAPPHGVLRHGDGFPDGCPCGMTVDSTTALAEEGRILLYALGLTAAVDDIFARLARFTGGDYFLAQQGATAIASVKQTLEREFQDLDVDRRVLEFCRTLPDWTIDTLCDKLELPRGRVSASMSRLGRRGLLPISVYAHQ